LTRGSGPSKETGIEKEVEDEQENDWGTTENLDRMNKPGFFL
jgi:hypothetical protein